MNDRCNVCGRELVEDCCVFCRTKDTLYSQELLYITFKYRDDPETLEREIRKLNFKYNNCK